MNQQPNGDISPEKCDSTSPSDVVSQLPCQDSLVPFQRADWRRGLWQLVNTLLPYLALWYLTYRCLSISYWLAILPAILAGGFMVRIFIIFHDCGHGSFFRSQRVNSFWGFVTGYLTFTPHHHWHHDHAMHHAAAGNLDKRGFGDIWTLTVKEYLALSPIRRFGYRLFRNPLVLFGVIPILMFLFHHRMAMPKSTRKDRIGVWGTNIALLATVVGMHYLIGLKAYLLVQIPILYVASSVGVWMFYVQHQFEDVYWDRHQKWNFVTEALEGSSFYKLPKVLQWFTGSIGYHHVHHLSPSIPNYHLEKCHEKDPALKAVKPITFWKSLESCSFRLWDEESRKLVSFDFLKKHRTA